MLIHGADRIAHGAEHVAAGLVRDFADTILPVFLRHSFALTLPFTSGFRGLLIVGLPTRLALVVDALLMIVLVFGMTCGSGLIYL
jgi:hypothetical protein